MTTPSGDPTNKHARISREELDRLFDRELSSPERRDLVGRLGRDPFALDEVTDVRRMVNTMRTGLGPTPDLTGAVMDRIDRSTGFMSPRLRRRVKTGRLAAAACVLVALLGVTFAQRAAPARFRTSPIATPVADLSNAVRQDSAEGRQRLTDAVTTLAASNPAPSFICDQPAQTPHAGMVQVTASITSDTSVPARYLTLTASADAEVLALAHGDTRGTVFLSGSSYPITQGSITTIAVAGSASGSFDGPSPGSHPATEIRAGVVPLSFGSSNLGSNTRAAYVGKRYFLPPAILHDTEYAVSRREQRP